MYDAFTLVLTVNHACNLRCSYCYTGAKVHRPMSDRVATAALERAIASVRPGGRLDLGFFGGEPLIEPRLIGATVARARAFSKVRELRLSWGLTTNGTCVDLDAWAVMTAPDAELSISHDGLPALHDRHRVTIDGRGTSVQVERTMRRLIAFERDFNVVVVVRPDTVESLADGIRHLRDLGVRRVEPSLDLWTTWTADDIDRLRGAVAECAALWREGLPQFSMSWFDEKLLRFAGVRVDAGSRCGFGDGQIAVAPSGNLYPCERVIGEDRPGQPLRLPGHALDGRDFLPAKSTCSGCSTMCPCSNFVRSGSPGKPDELLRALDRMCEKEMLRVMELQRGPHD